MGVGVVLGVVGEAVAKHLVRVVPVEVVEEPRLLTLLRQVVEQLLNDLLGIGLIGLAEYFRGRIVVRLLRNVAVVKKRTLVLWLGGGGVLVALPWLLRHAASAAEHALSLRSGVSSLSACCALPASSLIGLALS